MTRTINSGNNFGASSLCLLFVLGAALLPAGAVAADNPTLQLDWKDLVASDWEPPIILPVPDGEGASHVDPASLNQTLAGNKVKLPGYMKPVEFTNNSVREFLLVPYLDKHVKRHSHLDANQMVYVKLDEPVVIENPYIPYFVTGTIDIATIITPDGPAAYTISEASVELYVY